jgi:hypothetical protein
MSSFRETDIIELIDIYADLKKCQDPLSGEAVGLAQIGIMERYEKLANDLIDAMDLLKKQQVATKEAQQKADLWRKKWEEDQLSWVQTKRWKDTFKKERDELEETVGIAEKRIKDLEARVADTAEIEKLRVKVEALTKTRDNLHAKVGGLSFALKKRDEKIEVMAKEMKYMDIHYRQPALEKAQKDERSCMRRLTGKQKG